MPSSVDLGAKLEKIVAGLVSKGRYNSKSEVIREGVRLVQERENRLAALDAALDAALGRGLADIEAGRTYPAEEVFAEVRRKIREVAAKKHR